MRAFLTALPLYGLCLFSPTWNVLANLQIATLGRPVQVWLAVPILVATCAVTLAYAWPVFATARAVMTHAVDGVDDSLLGSAVSLLATGTFVRLSAEAQHLHDAARPIGIGLHAMALACAALALWTSLQRCRWAAAAFRPGNANWSVVAYARSAHGPVAPLDATGDAAVGDGVIVRLVPNATTPYRAPVNEIPVARTWQDASRAVRPLARRRTTAAVLVGIAAAAAPLLAGRAPSLAHLEEEDTWYAPAGSLSFPPQCRRYDTIYFLPMGQQRGIDVDGLAAHYGDAYHRPFIALPPRALPPVAYDGKRRQWAAETILDELTRDASALAPKGAVIVALTSDDLYRLDTDDAFVFTYAKAAVSIISNAGLGSNVPGDPNPGYRLRKMITRDLGIRYCSFPYKHHPRSILFAPEEGLPDVEDMDESVW